MSRDASKSYSLSDRLEYWESLSWGDLNHWAGASSVRKGRSYQRGGRVKQLSLSDDGWLLATVQGTSTYAVSVWIESAGDEDGRLKSECTCPIGRRCKHAVAVIAEYLDAVACGRKVPRADVNDSRWEKLARLNEPFGNAHDDDAFEVDDFEDDDDRVGGRLARDLSKRGKRSKNMWDERIADHVAQMSVAKLREVVTNCLQRFPELREEFRERLELSESEASQLVAQARRAIEEASSEPGWTSRWGGDSSIPDYRRVKSRFQKLAEVGAHDALVELGLELLSAGTSQVEQSNDEGETRDEIRNCLSIAFKSLAKSTSPPEKKILLAIDACLDDGYELVDE